jgi:hypothetical protein
VILALILDGIQSWMEKIKSGRCNVVEKNHILILGWTSVCFALIRELDLSCETGVTIVILCERDQKELRHLVYSTLPCYSKSKIIFRNGSPSSATDLVTVSVNCAKAIVIPAPPGDADEADNSVLSIILALNTLSTPNVKNARPIIAELRDVDNEDVVHLLGGHAVVTMVSHDLVGRMLVMAAQQPRLATVYKTMLGFDGDEFYMKQWPIIAGFKFRELAEIVPDAIVCGVCRFNKVVLNPDPDYVMKEADELVVIAESSGSYEPQVNMHGYLDCGTPSVVWPPKQQKQRYRRQRHLSKFVKIDRLRQFCLREAPQKTPVSCSNHLLVIGWRRDLLDMLLGLDSKVGMGANQYHVHLYNELTLEQREENLLQRNGESNNVTFRRIVLHHYFGSPVSRRDLEKLDLDLLSCVAPLTPSSPRCATLKVGTLEAFFMQLSIVPHCFPFLSKRSVSKRGSLPHCLPGRFSQRGSLRVNQRPSRSGLSSVATICITAGEKNEVNSRISDSKNNATLTIIRQIQARHAINRCCPATPQLSPIGQIQATREEPQKERKTVTNIHPLCKKALTAEQIQQKRSVALIREQQPASFSQRQRNIMALRESVMETPKTIRRVVSEAEMALADLNPCIVEVLDIQTHMNTQIFDKSSHFMHSNDMASKVLAQTSVRRELKNVVDELLGTTGNGIFLRPALDYLHVDVADVTCVCFMGLARRTYSRGAILLGYWEKHKTSPVINPKDKFVVDNSIDWYSTQLIVLTTSA